MDGWQPKNKAPTMNYDRPGGYSDMLAKQEASIALGGMIRPMTLRERPLLFREVYA